MTHSEESDYKERKENELKDGLSFDIKHEMNVINEIFRKIEIGNDWFDKDAVASLRKLAGKKPKLSCLLDPVIKIIDMMNHDDKNCRLRIISKYISSCQWQRHGPKIISTIYAAVMHANLEDKSLKNLQKIQAQVTGMHTEILEFAKTIQDAKNTYTNKIFNGNLDGVNISISNLVRFALNNPNDDRIKAETDNVFESLIKLLNKVFFSKVTSLAQREFESNVLIIYKNFYTTQLSRENAIQALLGNDAE